MSAITDILRRNIQRALIDMGIEHDEWLAYLCDLWGVGRHTVTRVLKGKNQPKPRYIERLSEESGLPEEWFFQDNRYAP